MGNAISLLAVNFIVAQIFVAAFLIISMKSRSGRAAVWCAAGFAVASLSGICEPAIYADAKALCRWRLCKRPCRFLPAAYRPWQLLQCSGETAATCVLFHGVSDRRSFHL
ncbi:hypothetical protein EMEDMD4_970003 [Sinorhizobium medicae]|uniref:Uncharacterized protein n=1 Tax=Sinorhizobium medicae TaxID=110321 RepID=A0A508X8K2_9HYPH|nr:hypothetical protein EMEDMD4_970003 [Sinorhizobium medicae]